MAANRICKVLKVNQDNERLMEEYERLASDVSSRKKKHSVADSKVALKMGNPELSDIFYLHFFRYSSWNGSVAPFLG